VVDISHTGIRRAIGVVKQTLAEIGAANKKTILLFNKIDAYNHEKAGSGYLMPVNRMLSLEEWKRHGWQKANSPCIFISAQKKAILKHKGNAVCRGERHSTLPAILMIISCFSQIIIF